MARPIKTGLDYFPLDVNIFNDEKIQFVEAKYGGYGELICVKLLCKIYKEGYMTNWDDDTALLFSKHAGRNITTELVNGVVCELLKRDFFSKELYDKFQILTSRGIQNRYLKICQTAKRKDSKIPKKYLVVELTTEETELTTEESTQRKEKEIKEKENKALSEDFDFSFVDEQFKIPFQTFYAYRSKKKPFKVQDEVENTYRELISLSVDNPQEAVKIVQYTIANGWSSLQKRESKQIKQLQREDCPYTDEQLRHANAIKASGFALPEWFDKKYAHLLTN